MVLSLGLSPLLEMEKKVAGLFLSLSRLLFAAGDTGSAARVTAIHRLSVCSDRRGRKERVRQREKESQRAAGGWGTEGGSSRPKAP